MLRVTLRIAIAVCVVAAMAAYSSAQDSAGVYKVGGDVSAPVPTKKVNPGYTEEAIRARIEGIVQLAVVVREDGKVGDVTVTRSLDEVYGLDAEAVKAAKQFEFKPGTKNGKPVPVRVTLEFTFALK
jgi:TonB family protein